MTKEKKQLSKKDNNKKFSEKFREEELKRRGFEQVKNKDGSNQTSTQYKNETGRDAGSADGFVYRRIDGGQPVQLNNDVLN